MEFVICKDMEAVVTYVNHWVHRQVQAGRNSMFLPAGETPRPLYSYWEKNQPDFLKTLRFYQVDDILTGSKKNQFRHFFEKNLPSYTQQIQWIHEGTDQPKAAILGLGTNGHVAFHEPNLSPYFYSGCLQLAPETCQRLHLDPGTWGVSYGLQAFLKCQTLLLMVTGPSKQKILSELLSLSAQQKTFPAHYLLEHKNFVLVADEQAIKKGTLLPRSLCKITYFK